MPKSNHAIAKKHPKELPLTLDDGSRRCGLCKDVGRVAYLSKIPGDSAIFRGHGQWERNDPCDACGGVGYHAPRSTVE